MYIQMQIKITKNITRKPKGETSARTSIFFEINKSRMEAVVSRTGRTFVVVTRIFVLTAAQDLD